MRRPGLRRVTRRGLRSGSRPFTGLSTGHSYTFRVRQHLNLVAVVRPEDGPLGRTTYYLRRSRAPE